MTNRCPRIRWSNIQQVVPKGKRKPVEMKTAFIEGNDPRFVLVGSKLVTTMWTLQDTLTGSAYFLFGVGWEGGQAAAEGRITSILHPSQAKSIRAKEDAVMLQRAASLGLTPPRPRKKSNVQEGQSQSQEGRSRPHPRRGPRRATRKNHGDLRKC